jgi:kinesin family member 13
MSETSVKVAVRVRPFNEREIKLGAECCIRMDGNKTTIINEEGSKREFTFDYSFWSHDGYILEDNGYMRKDPQHTGTKYSDQEYVYNELGIEVLTNAWEGYHCCLFAYGQTGSGKSYSMIGYGENKGIVPQVTEEIFRRIDSNDDASRDFQVKASMVEIYNEKVQDLLIHPSKRPTQGLKIRENKTTGIYIEGIDGVPVSSYDEIEAVMSKGNKNRSIGAHAMNATSSRAHTIISIEFKQIHQTEKVKTEKLSIINLVDLAGSEKADQTGATGDRLKEGCAINKSLSTLGQVIKVLADKSSGKKSNEVVPYRNSALTRMLQNALGGNSKTLMICALSPANTNYEETLSTLRYADRAKSIKNKARVNESETEKLIRELKEENERLKKLMEEGGYSPSMKGDSDEYKKMLEQNQREMEEREKTWQQKLEEAKAKAEKEDKKVNLNAPNIANLNEDSQLDKIAIYNLTEQEKTYVGRKAGKPEPKVVLGGPGIQNNHAYFEYKDGDVFLKPNSKESKGQIKVNGKDIGKGVKLNHNDRIVFGAASVFLFRLPGEPEDPKIDFEMAQDEVNAELIEKQGAKMEEDRIEEETKLKEIEENYEKEKLEAQEKAKKEQEEQEKKLLQLKHLQEKLQEENERKKVEEQKRLIEEDIKRKEEERKLEELRAIEEKEEQIKLLEKKRKEHKRLDETLNMLLPMVKEANLSAEELKRKYKFEPKIVHEIDDSPGMSPLEQLKNSKSKVVVEVDNSEDGYKYKWDPAKFADRLYMMRDVMDEYFETQKIPELGKDEDPFWDPQEAMLIGRAYCYLKSLGYMLNNECNAKIMNTNYEGSCGSLT